MSKRGKVSSEDLSLYSLDNNDHKKSGTETQDTVCNRTQRMLRRDLCNVQEEEQLRSMNLLEDGMTKKMKSDVLKAIMASKETALAEDTRRTLVIASECEENVVAVSPCLNISENTPQISKSSQDHLANTSVSTCSPTSNQNETQTSISKKISNTGKHPEVDQEHENKSALLMRHMFAPDGVNPDEYAKVIMEELTRNNKKLYAMQRRSLNLLEWGPPIVGSTGTAAVVSQHDNEVDNKKQTAQWLSTKIIKSPPRPSYVDDNQIFEIDSPTSDESSQEEFLIGRKRKNTKKVAAKKKAQGKSKIPPKKGEKQLNAEDEGSDDVVVVPKQLLPLKRKGNINLDGESKVKSSKSADVFEFSDDATLKEDAKAVPTTSEPFNAFSKTSSRSNLIGKKAAAAAKTDEVSEGDKVACPLCAQTFSNDVIAIHASDCAGSSCMERDSTSAAQKSSKNVDFSLSRHCYVCGDTFALNVIDDHIAVCTQEEKSKKTDSSNTTPSSTPLGPTPDQFYARNRTTGTGSPFDSFLRSRGGLR